MWQRIEDEQFELERVDVFGVAEVVALAREPNVKQGCNRRDGGYQDPLAGPSEMTRMTSLHGMEVETLEIMQP